MNNIFPKVTYCGWILHKLIANCQEVKSVTSNWTGEGAEAVIADLNDEDKQKYHVSITPIRENSHD